VNVSSSYVVDVVVSTNVSPIPLSPSSLPRPTEKRCWMTTTVTKTTRVEPCLPVAVVGGGGRQPTATMAATHLLTHPLTERFEHRPRHDVFFVLVVPTCLNRLRRCRSPTKNPLPKLAEHGVVVIFRCHTAAIVALLLLLSNEQCANVDHGHQRRLD